MGSNTLLASVKSLGYKTAATGTAIVQNIDPVPGYRAAVVAFGASCSSTAARLYFLTGSVQMKISGALATGQTTVVFAADPATAASAKSITLTTGNIVITLANGTYQYTTIASKATALTVALTSALTSNVADGAAAWCLGLYSDAHQSYSLTINTQSTKDTSGAGIFYADTIGAPLMTYHPNNSSQIGSIDYVSLNYINA